MAITGGSGGDMVFDASGHLYIVSGNKLVRVNQSIPTTPADAQLSTTLLTTVATSSLNGVTFDGDGYLYASSSATLTKLNPNSGAVVSTVSIPGSNDTVDLADCQYNGQLQLRADVVGRYAGGGAGDQFGLTITGGGITSGNAAVTSGSGIGLQADAASTAGPTIALAGTTYDINETAADGASLANYAVAVSCVDTGNGNAPLALTQLTPGSNAGFSLVFPSAGSSGSSAVSCTFTDTPLAAPTITLAKQLAATRITDTDQFTVQIRTGGPAGPVVTSGAGATTTGSGTTVDPGTGTTGAFVASAGTTYYLTEAAAGTTVLADYQATISCTDAAALTAGLPSGAAFSGSLAISPANGAEISCVLSNGVQRYSLASLATPAVATPGAPVNYTITVTDTGSVAYLASTASFTDDLSAALDDASVVPLSATASAGSVSVVGATLSWAGPLAVTPAAGSTVIVTFQLAVDRPDPGDHELTTSLDPTGAGGACAAGCASTSPVQSYAVADSGPALVSPGQAFTDTLTITNTGAVAYPGQSARASVDLSGLLDDASLVPGSVSASAGSAGVVGSTLSWSGPLAVSPGAGVSVTVTFWLRVADPDVGDQILSAVAGASGPGGSCATPAGCTATADVQSYTVTKAAGSVAASPDDVVTYTVTVTSTGTAAYGGSSATFSDDLSDVLDDASVVPGSVSASAGSVAIAGHTLSWSGPLAVASTVSVEYQVRVDSPDTGNQQLDNLVTATAPGGHCASTSGCTTSTPIRSYSVAEAAGPAAVDPGQPITYTVTVVNTASAAYPSASFTADLAGALDDATLVPGSVTASAGTVDLSGDQLSWSGPVAAAPGAGSMVIVTFQLQVDEPDSGDHLVATSLAATAPGGSCVSSCATQTPIRSYSASVSVDAGTVSPGGTVGYTITVVNTGRVPYSGSSASFHDNLQGVGDDASYVPLSASASAGTMQVSNGAVSWVGSLPVAPAAGYTVVIRFRVRVRSPETGDGVLASTLAVPGAGGSCAPGCSAQTLLQRFSVAVGASATSIAPGEVITYTITAASTGHVAYPAGPASAAAGFSDDLSDIVDDASVVAGSLTASAGSAELVGNTLAWTGPLTVTASSGSTVVVTFAVRLDDPDTGNRALGNRLQPTGPGATTGGAGSALAPMGVRSFSVTASMAASGVGAGSIVHFSVTVRSTGTAPFTTSDPAMFSVELSGAFTNARYDDDGSAGVSYAPGVLSWSGPLRVGASTVVSYSLTLADAPGALIDRIVTAAGSGGSCGSGTAGCPVPMSSAAGSGLAFTGVDVRAGLGAGLAVLTWGAFLLAIAAARRRRS